jgi:prefoldin subunit 5
MTSPEVVFLQGQVHELREDVKDLKLAVSGLQTMEPRVKAVEAQQRAQDARLEHIDRVVMSIQGDIQKLQKTFSALETHRAEDRQILGTILETQHRMLDLLQPKVTVG